jgi:hypothetical protein
MRQKGDDDRGAGRQGDGGQSFEHVGCSWLKCMYT